MSDQLASLTQAIGRDGFALSARAGDAALLEQAGLADWDSFAASWDDLGVDTFMADGGRYRRRRFRGVSRARPKAIVRKPHQPHYQSRDYNPLNGGIERWFEPVDRGDRRAPGPARDPRDLPRACSTV